MIKCDIRIFYTKIVLNTVNSCYTENMEGKVGL